VLSTAKTTKSTHLTKIDALKQASFYLGREIEAGRHVLTGMRVLCLPNNPDARCAEASAEVVEPLRRENAVLLRRVRELEREHHAGAGAGGGEEKAGGGEGKVDDGSREKMAKGGKGTEELVPRES